MTIGRATYQPGWKWSEHVGPTAGTPLCEVEHVGLVISGRVAVRMRDGSEQVLSPGTAFFIAPGHDSWVVGNEPYVSLHLTGAGEYLSLIHISEPTRLLSISYAVFCLKKKTN